MVVPHHISNLKKAAHQGDLISAYLLVTALEIIFEMIKSNPNKRKL